MAFAYCREITLNADAYISSAVSNYPVFLKFNSTDHPHLFEGDDGDSVCFTSDAEGASQLAHECVSFSSSEAIFYVKCDLSASGDTAIYFWYGDASNSGEENKSGTWYAGYSIHHFQDSLASSISGGYSFSMTGSLSYSSNGVSGKALTGWSSSNYLTASSCGAIYNKAYSTGNDDSAIVMAKSAADKVTFYGGNTSWNGRGPKMYSRGGADVYGLSDYYFAGIGLNEADSNWVLCMAALDGGTSRQYRYNSVSGYATNSTTTKTSYSYSDRGIIVGRCYAPNNLGSSDLIDFIWIFTEDKSPDYFKAVYNNHINVSSFVSVGSEENLGGTEYQESLTATVSTSPTLSLIQALLHNTAYSVTASPAINAIPIYIEDLSAVILLSPSLQSTAGYSVAISSSLSASPDLATAANHVSSLFQSVGIAPSVYTFQEVAAEANIATNAEMLVGLAYAESLGAAIALSPDIGHLMVDIELLEAEVTASPSRLYVGFERLEACLTASPSLSILSTGRTVLFWSIVVDGVILEENNDLEYAKFTDEKGKRSDYFEIVLDNRDGSISDTFALGNDVYLYLDENDPPETKVFHGLITGIDFEMDFWGHNKLILSGEDYGSVRFGQTVISGAENYSNTTASDIMEDIILRYCPEITTENLETFSEQIPFISFAWEYVSQAIDKIARLAGADYYVDENDDLHFYDPYDLTASHALASSQILNAKIKRDSSKFFDRVFVVGGKQGFLDQSQAATTTEVSLHDKYYASSFTPSKTNVLYVEAYIKKIGNPLDAFRFMILEDNSGPKGAIVGFGSIPAKNTSTDGSWVKSDYIEVQLDISKLHWIVFQKYGAQTDTYKIAHDSTTASGHKYSTDGSSWNNGTGKCAFKTYYGVQIVKGASGTKMFDNHTDIPIVDFSIKDTDTALMLAQQKVIEYALKNSSKMEINPPGKRLRAGEVISVSIPGVTLEDQTILSVSYEINGPHIAKVKLECTAAEDFYSTFANLFAELRRLKVENVLQLQETSTDYKETTETPAITLIVTIIDNSTGYTAKFDDGRSRWNVSKWT